ncbi:MAG: UDP-N-acetylglucosamine 1-carboxyvinyltransferase, partial [Bacilli bacterium]
MEKIIVRGGTRLSGRIKIDGAKNAVLPIIAASILAESDHSIILDVPPLDDVFTISEVLKALGIKTEYSKESINIDARTITSTVAPYEFVRKMRASFLVMGPLLARVGHARIALPGGCAIGTRPIDQHL